jgi:hypothetical protein
VIRLDEEKPSITLPDTRIEDRTMPQLRNLFVGGSLIVFVISLVAVRRAESIAPAADSTTRIFEIRTYTTEPGKLADLLKLMREHAVKLIENHGMISIGYWVPTDKPRSQDTFIYILAHESRDAAKKSWSDFKIDSEWIKSRKASEANGKIFHKVESVFAAPTDFSPIK